MLIYVVVLDVERAHCADILASTDIIRTDMPNEHFFTRVSLTRNIVLYKLVIIACLTEVKREKNLFKKA